MAGPNKDFTQLFIPGMGLFTVVDPSFWRRRFLSLRAGASRPMAQPVVRPPVTYVSLVSNYPSPRAKRERKPLSEVLTPNQPAVLHLFTG